MTRALPFTRPGLVRAITAARQAGLHVVGIRPDGTIITYDGNGLPAVVAAALAGQTDAAFTDLSEEGRSDPWDFLEKEENRSSPAPKRRGRNDDFSNMTPEQLRVHFQKQRQAYEESIPGSPLNKREIAALKIMGPSGEGAVFPWSVKGLGMGTMDRLCIRGYVEEINKRQGCSSDHRLLAEGVAAWKRLQD